MEEVLITNKKIFITGAAGFIGSNLVIELLNTQSPLTIIGIDSLNDYYDVSIKEWRLSEIQKCAEKHPDSTWTFIKGSITDKSLIDSIFHDYKPDIVVNLAAQAGVRYSITNPDAYIESNIIGFYNILEACRNHPIEHLVYASSSSVYGGNKKVPFSTDDKVDNPVSLYAATKKSNELMAHTYSHLYGIPSTGLRFFTVYGPWGRPDMSPFLFADAMLHGRPIKVFNNGDMLRDFTYIDDIIEGILRVIDHIPTSNQDWSAQNPDPSSSTAPYKIYNIGNSHPVKLMDFIQAIEGAIGHPAEKIYLPMQPGDVYQTNADTSALQNELGFKPDKPIKEGVQETIDWYRSFYQL